VITLVLGGTRSGKSEHAEFLVAGADPVTYVATAQAGDDESFVARVRAHRARRPPSWRTVEPDDLPQALRDVEGTALVDSIGTWIARFADFDAPVSELCTALVERAGDTVVVSEEVGLGVHPPTDVGVRFADALGSANRSVADVSDRVLLVVAGRALEL
jgi:adenosyl cobinamide kinase/adenosyl cobinamide phosphate guanylyltransferase